MKKEIKKLQDNNINDNEDFQNSNQDFKKSEGKFTIISNDSIHKSNIKSDSIDIEESNNTLNDNKKFEEEDEEDDEFEEERIRAFNEIMNKKERPVEVIKEVDEEYDSDFHMSPVKINKDYHHENNNIHKNEQFAFKKLDYEINDNKKKNNNYSHFNEIMNKKERPVEVIKEVDEEYDSDFHMSPIKNNKDYHNENNIHKNDNLGFKKLDFDINDNKNKNNNYSNFNVENNEKNINNNNNNNYNNNNYNNNNIYNNINSNDNNSNEDDNKENMYNNENYQNTFQNIISPIKDDKFLESQSDIVNQKINYSPLISDANNIQINTPNFINEKMKFEEKKIPSGDIEKIDSFIRMLKIKKNQNIYYENKNNHNKEKEEEEEKKKQNYIENRRKKMEDIKNKFSNKTKEKKNYEEEKNNVNKKSKFKELVKITNSVPSIL